VGHNITGVGFGVMAALILVVGIITTNVVGKRFIHWSESLLARVPITRVLYVAIRQIVQSFTEPNKTGFMQVVLVEFPAKGMKTIAFITNEETDKNGEKFFNVFIPTAFNPTGGFLEIVREEDIIRTNLSVEEALKMAVSAGRMSPQGLGDSLMRADSQDKSNEQKAK
ncbi:MAG: DUF502 domain-containing protein, partial [Dehalococcoidales bacterium]|nr:DUF502 domain-containing protein [Dehalococcoidales bacterium]